MTERVLLVVESFRSGGLLSQVTSLAERLASRGFQPHICALSNRGTPAESLRRAASLHDAGRRHAVDPVAAWKLRQVANRIRPSIVHAWGDVAADYAAITTGSRKVATLGRRSRSQPAYRRWLASRIRQSNNLLVAPSDESATQIGGAEVISPGVESSEGKCNPSEARDEIFNELCLPADARVIVVAGRMLPCKGVKELIWTADLLRVIRDEIRLLVIGDGPELPALERFARMASDLEHIRLLGDRSDVRRVLAAADVFWHAGDEASPPVAVLEAMAAGVPVVADDTIGCRGVIVDGESGRLVPPAGRAIRARATESLLADASERQRIGSGGQQVVADHYAADRMADEYARIYHRLLA